jgi:hypothetical protein
MKTTYQITADYIKEGNKKELFDIIYLNGASEVGSTLLAFVKDCSNTFCSDIATRGYNQFIENSRVNLSEKQTWCLVFDILKNSHQFEAWVEKEIETLNN